MRWSAWATLAVLALGLAAWAWPAEASPSPALSGAPALGPVSGVVAPVEVAPPEVFHVRGATPIQAAGTQPQMQWFGADVQRTPKVDLVLWGWGGADPSGVATPLVGFFRDVGNSSYGATLTQYTDAHGAITSPPGQLAHWATDDAHALPSNGASESAFDLAIAQEASRAVAAWGYDAGTDYVVATPHGHSPPGFGVSYCAWHSWFTDGLGRKVAFTLLPYMPDAGGVCGAQAVHAGASGLLDGVTLAAGHEWAETITDPTFSDANPPPFGTTGWTDGASQGEVADKCAGGPDADVLLAGTAYPLQPLWSNAERACVLAPTLADVRLVAAFDPDPVVGLPVAVHATISNLGPNPVPSVEVKGLPSGYTMSGATSSSGSCAAHPAGFGCTLGALGVGENATVTFTGTPTAAGTIQAAVTIIPHGVQDVDTGDNSGILSASARLLHADLAVAATLPPTAVVGDPSTLHVTVTDNGTDDAPAALTLALPAGFAVTALTPSQGSCGAAPSPAAAGGTVTCDLGVVSHGAFATVDVLGSPTRAGRLALTARVPVAGSLDARMDNVATGTFRSVLPVDDLRVQATGPASALAGDALAVNVTVGDLGPHDAPDVLLAGTLPGVLVGSVTPSQGTCAVAGLRLTCDLGALATGANATVALRLTPTRAGPFAPSFTVRAAGGSDPVRANDRASATTAVASPSTDLRVGLSADAPWALGATLNLTANVTAAGPDDAPGVRLVLSLPRGSPPLQVTASQGACTSTSTQVTCLLGRLAAGDHATVWVQVLATRATAAARAQATPMLGGSDPTPLDAIRSLALP